ncbi:MAG: SCO family protein [Myxococcales bacterium]|nr:SCO family protein [Myxococcales bacterium]
MIWIVLAACTASTEPKLTALDLGVESDSLGPSLYDLEVTLESSTGSAVSLAVHEGHPTLVSMFYASCPMACPMLIGDVQALEAELTSQQRADLRVLLISLDPERDDPELLAQVMAEHELDETRWTLARPTEADLRPIAAVLGVRYRALADGEMSHSSIVTLLDRQGSVRFTLEGLRADATPLLAQLSAL